MFKLAHTASLCSGECQVLRGYVIIMACELFMKVVASKNDRGKGHQVTAGLLLSYSQAHFCQQQVDALLVLHQAGMILLQPVLQRQAQLNNATGKIAMLLAPLCEPRASNELREGWPVSRVCRQHLKQDGLAVGR